MAKKNKGFVVGHDPKIGRGSFANMPQEVIMKEYPKPRHLGAYLDDTMVDIDEVNDRSIGRAARHESYQK